MEVLGDYFAGRSIEKLVLSDCAYTPGNIYQLLNEYLLIVALLSAVRAIDKAGGSEIGDQSCIYFKLFLELHS